MRALVCGGRDWTDAPTIYRELDGLHKRLGIGVVIEGDQRGVDRMAGYWARRNRIDNLKFKADWGGLGGRAGPIRNKRMIDEGRPDIVVAFPGGKGTANMVHQARVADIRVIFPLGNPSTPKDPIP